jgi:hypothetical protein
MGLKMFISQLMSKNEQLMKYACNIVDIYHLCRRQEAYGTQNTMSQQKESRQWVATHGLITNKRQRRAVSPLKMKTPSKKSRHAVFVEGFNYGVKGLNCTVYLIRDSFPVPTDQRPY